MEERTERRDWQYAPASQKLVCGPANLPSLPAGTLQVILVFVASITLTLHC
jgi:hypothetical protein